jgi:hypothetical protein
MKFCLQLQRLDRGQIGERQSDKSHSFHMTPDPVDPLIRFEVGIVERAFQLASSGKFGDLDPIIKRLTEEGYHEVERHLCGYSTLRRELRALCRESGEMRDYERSPS